MENEYRDMVKHCLYELISRWDAMEKHDTMPEALKYAVHDKGGFTITKGHRSNDDYWFFEYEQNYKFRLLKYYKEDEQTITEVINKKLAKQLLNEIWIEYNNKGIQLKIAF